MADLMTLAYTIIAGLVGVAFFLGRLSKTVENLRQERDELRRDLHDIFTRLDALARAAERNEVWHARKSEE